MLVEADTKYGIDISKRHHVIFTSPVLSNIHAVTCSVCIHFLIEN